MEYEDYCEVWPESPQILEDEDSQESPTSKMFSLVFHLSFLHIPADLTEDIDQDGLFDINGLMETTVDDQTFEVECNRLIDNTTASRQTLEGVLSSMHVPCRPFLVEKILKCARDMASDRVYENCKVLRMHVRMNVVVIGEEEEEVLSTLFSESDETETTMVGASKSAMEKLEMVAIENQNFRCAICLEDFCFGLRVLRMPCSHIFHRHCIENWLNNSKFCPLCRFEMN